MLEVNNSIIMDDISDILVELRRQLEIEGIKRFPKIIISGDNIQTNCPFHKNGQERKPSFGILNKKKGNDPAGTCHCFGCGWTGSFAEMVSNCFGYDDMGLFGGKWLARNFLSVSVESRPDVELDMGRGSKVKEKKSYITDEELDSYRYTHPYMYQRKMNDAVIELFDIGYDKKTGCITFPIRDICGNCLFVARRSVSTKFFNYPQNVDKPVYGLYELSRLENYPNEIIICESMIDAITCWVYGSYAVALNGLGNELQFKQLLQMPNRKFILATDMDEAGLRARDRIKNHLKDKIVTQYIWDVKKAKDINDMSQEMFDSLKEIF